jgi:Trk K+ transport system NAD-binding subunit
MARLLQVTSTQATGAVIVGSNPLSRLLAHQFQDRGEFVVLIDTDEEACREAERENLRTFLSSAFDEVVLEAAGIESVGTFLAVTKNPEVNLAVSQRVVEEFSPPRVLAVFPRNGAGGRTSPSKKIAPAFTPDLSLKAWNQYLRDGAVKLGETQLRDFGFDLQRDFLKDLIRASAIIPLLLERDDRVDVVGTDDVWKPGDRILYLLHDPKPHLLKRLSGSSQGKLVAERLPAVEEVPITQPTNVTEASTEQTAAQSEPVAPAKPVPEEDSSSEPSPDTEAPSDSSLPASDTTEAAASKLELPR